MCIESDMRDITYVEGDATAPIGIGAKLICHVCNDNGGWGKGFVLAISRRWPQPEASYRAWHRDGEEFHLGAVQFVDVGPQLAVANMIGQHGTKPSGRVPPVRYEAIDAALSRVGDEALRRGASVHMPRIGCGLAGGTWDRVEPIIIDRLAKRDISVTVYDFVSQ